MTLTPVPNGGFETAGSSPGSADGWTFESMQGSGYRYAAFGSVGSEIAFESFEIGWDNDDYLTAFETSDLEAAMLLPTNKSAEDFEESWDGNENWSDSLVSTGVALFDVAEDPYEDFEQEWSDNEDFLYAFDPGDLEASVFGTGADEFENFEQEWRDNENYIFGFGVLDLDAAVFDVAEDEFEDFETEWPTIVLETL